MAISKRPLEDDNCETSPQAKKVTITAPSKAANSEDESVQPYLDRIAELEILVEAFGSFVSQKELYLDVPAALVPYLDSRPNAAGTLACHLLRKITEVYNVLHENDGPEINNDDYAEELLQFLPDVTRLSKLECGLPLAWDVLLLLVDRSRSHDAGNGSDRNAFESPYAQLDDTMVEVAKAAWEQSTADIESDTERMSQDLADLESTAEMMNGCGIEKYLEKTIQYLKATLLAIYTDEDISEHEEEDDEEEDVEEGYEDEDDEEDSEEENIFRALNGEDVDPHVEEVQGGNKVLSMSQMVDPMEGQGMGEQISLIV